MPRVPYLELLPGHAPVPEKGRVDIERHLVGSTPVLPVPLEFVAQVAKDLDVQDWLISCTEIEETRSAYLEHLARFLYWCQWTPGHIWELKQEAMKRGQPHSPVETQIRRYHEALRTMGYAGKTRAKLIAAIYSYISSKGYPIPRKLVRLDMADKFSMRVPEQNEIELFVQYASTIDMKLLYTLLTETPCRPRVFPALRWNWLESNWQEKDVIHVALPKQFRPMTQGGPRKFEPICFLGRGSIELLKQVREARILQNQTPLETDQILKFTIDAAYIAVRRDFENLVRLGLIKASRVDEKGHKTEQIISPKSWRKYQFNLIDSLTDISTEWRKMLKGRDLDTERYYSKENIEALRKIYRERIYPHLWTTPAAYSAEEVKELRLKIEDLETKMGALEDIAGIHFGPQEVKA